MAAVSSAGRAFEVEPLELGADNAAAAALFERHSKQVFRYCNARLRKREDAEDAVQTTFLYAVRSLGQGVKPLVESAWLLGIARNVCLSRWEATGRRRQLEAVCDPHDLDRSAAAPEGRREELIGLEDALARMPERQRQAVLLRDWRGLSYDEVADRLGVSRAAVETLIFRGRERLAEHLREEPGAIRRRLGLLGNLGALVNAVKAVFTGGAAAAKLAVAGTAIAVSGAGIAAVPLIEGGAPAPARPDVSSPAPALTPAAATPAAATPAPPLVRSEQAPVAPVQVVSGPADAAPDRAEPALRTVSPPAQRAAQPPVRRVDSPVAATPGPAAAAPRAAVPAPAASAPATKREQSPAVVPAVQAPSEPTLVPTVTTAVDDVVTTVVPELSTVTVPEVSEVPVVGPVVETVVETTESTVASLPVVPVEPVDVVSSLPVLPSLGPSLGG